MSLGVGQRNRLRQPRPRLVFVTYSAVVTGSETQDGKPSGSNTEPNPNLKQSKLPFVEDTGDLLKEEQKNKEKAELEESEKKSKKDAKLKKELQDRQRGVDQPSWTGRERKWPETHDNAKRYFLEKYILEYCKWMADDPKYNDNHKAKRANCRIFYQTKANTTTRLIFGHDAVRPDD
ncbi:hypothetical protein EYR41_004179 [Orbilia oligospora]|uniref:Uncharacterized protein n=1 Tax=Orbilia oligospora TaxID=2813651 RepID=A0A7C8KR28_ORBOL|nr:hypothetical protein TWF751_007530 [Orbilia oligospora]TGJ72272.1 hypothetical protein EYR41_004179 [Orbilia oligospora]